MPLFLIQDSDRPMHVIAGNYQGAVGDWRAVVAAENDCDIDQVWLPDGIAHLAPDSEIVINGRLREPLEAASPDDSGAGTEGTEPA